MNVYGEGYKDFLKGEMIGYGFRLGIEEKNEFRMLK